MLTDSWVRNSDKVQWELLISASLWLCPQLETSWMAGEDTSGGARSTAKMASSLTCLALWWDGGKARLSWDCHLSTYMWPLHHGGLTIVVRLLRVFLQQKIHAFWPQKPHSRHFPVLYWLKQSQACPDSREGIRPHLSVEGISKNLGAVFENHHTGIIP